VVERRANTPGIDIECAPFAVYLVDVASGTVVYGNPRYYSLIGYSPEEVRALGNDFYKQIYHPDDARRWRESDRRLVADRDDAVFDGEYRIVTKVGDTRWVFVREMVHRRDPDGTARELVGFAIDISDRKQSEDRYAAATRAGRVGVWDWDLADDSIYVDPELKAILGYADEEIANTLADWGSLVHPEDREAVAEAGRAYLAGESPVYEIEHRMIHRDGSVRWFLARGEALRGPGGTPVRIVGTDTDITELVETRRSLQESEERYRAIVDMIYDGVAIMDGATEEIIYSSPRYDRIWERPHRESLGRRTPAILENIHPDDREQMMTTIRSALAAGEPDATYSFRRRRADGTWRWIENVSRFVYTDAGTLDRAYIVARDITERVETERKLREALDERSRLMREMNHRIKNNLLSLTAMLNLMADRMKSSEAREALLETRSRVDAMFDIHDMLQHADSGGTVSLADQVTRVVDRFRRMHPDAEFVLDTAPVAVWLDRVTPVCLVLNEVLTNAVKHARRPDQTLTVSISLSGTAETAELRIEDNGPGMAPELLHDSGDSFGMLLIRSMAAQIDGTVAFENGDDGTALRATLRWDHR